MERKTVLLIDDEENILKIIKKFLEDNFFSVKTAKTKKEALDLLKKQSFDIVLSDYRLPDGTGFEILDFFRSVEPKKPFIMITAYGSINGAVEAMRRGASHYIAKPIDFQDLLKILQFYTKKEDQKIEEKDEFCGIIGKSKQMKELFKDISIVAQSEATVLIEGECGTGKELVARAIHSLSRRKDNPFIGINCSAIPVDLFENELFGHEKGSFTGAVGKEIGKIELAGEGTLFLDEIGDLPQLPQAKLLRVLQEREFYRIGGTKTIPVKCRIIAATNKDLEQLVEEGTFREDLFYRINVIHIKIPPLRERKEDIPLLVNHFLDKFNRLNYKNILSVDKEVMDILMEYDWPGNVRELENAIERAVVMCQHDTIKKEHLPPRIFKRISRNSSDTVIEDMSLNNTNLLEIEKKVIMKVLEETNWNQTKAAEKLGISRKQLRTKMKNLGLLK